MITHILRNGIILPLSDDVVFHEFLDIISHQTGLLALCEYGSALLGAEDE